MKRIAVIHVGLPSNMRQYWEDTISRYDITTKWIEPLTPHGKIMVFCHADTRESRYIEFIDHLKMHGIQYPDDTQAPNYNEQLQEALKSHGMTWSIARIELVYTDQELRSFPFLHLLVERKEIDPFGPSHGTEYDRSTGCPRCGCGATQISPFYAPAKSFPKTGLICASSTETFIADKLADALRRAEVTGVELRQAQSAREREALPWWQIMPRVVLPKMSPATKGITRGSKPPPCPVCMRDGHYNTMKEPESIVYDKQLVDPETLPDIVASWECFAASYLGSPRNPNIRFANPAILIKPSVFDIFHKLKVKHARFEPVRIE